MSLYKLYFFLDYVDVADWDVPPHEIDYRTAPSVRLTPKRTFVKGELQKVEYYADYDQATDTYSNIVVQEDISYTRVNGFVASREMVITWYFKDGTASPITKSRLKYYTGKEAIAEGKRRRANIINLIEISVVGLIAQAEGVTVEDAAAIGETFLASLNLPVSNYERSGNTQLITDVQNATETWLDKPAAGQPDGVTIRDFIVDQLTI